MPRLAVALIAVAGACLAMPSSAWSQSDQAGNPWYRGISLNEFAEASYSYNYNHPSSGLDALRVFDSADQDPRLDVVQLVVQRAVSKPGAFGFRVDATAGQSLPEATAAYGLFRDTRTGKAHHYDLPQFFASWVTPVGTGLRIDVGKFVTPFGYELIEGYEGYNDNQTRSLLFGYAIPFTHTGLRASYVFSDQLSGSAMVVQGWDNWRDNNTAKSVGAQLAWAPAKAWGLTFTAMGGPERANDNHDNRLDFEFVGTCKPNERLSLALDMVTGRESGLPAPGETARWNAAAAYVRYGLTERVALAFRVERFDDADGARTGVPQTIDEATLTAELKMGKHFILRGDLRRDASSESVFQKESEPAAGQTTVTTALLFVH